MHSSRSYRRWASSASRRYAPIHTMIAKIIEFSIRNRFLVLLLTGMLVIAGIWATLHISLDAIPDLSDAQVIVITDYPGQAPQVVEDQVTYPLTTAMMGIPKAKVVR